MLEAVAASTPGLGLRFTQAPAGAVHYRDTGTSLPKAQAMATAVLTALVV